MDTLTTQAPRPLWAFPPLAGGSSVRGRGGTSELPVLPHRLVACLEGQTPAAFLGRAPTVPAPEGWG